MKTYLKTIALSLVGLGCVSSHAQSIRDSVVTVEQMLVIDSRHAAEKVREEAVKSGVIDEAKKAEARPGPPPLPKWAVRSVFGVSHSLKADITVGSTAYYSMEPGRRIEACVITAVVDKCVFTERADAKRKKVRKGECPERVCWTGDELAAELRPSQVASTPAPLPSPTPVPIPLPSSSVMPTPLPAR